MEMTSWTRLAGAPLATYALDAPRHVFFVARGTLSVTTNYATCACARCGAKRCSTSLIPAFANKIHVCFLIIINHVMPAWMDIYAWDGNQLIGHHQRHNVIRGGVALVGSM